MRTVQLIYIVLVFSFASEAESKLWILKLFQKAINGIRGMKEGSAAASAVAVAAVGGGAVADTIINLNAEENTPIAGAQKTLSDDVLVSSIVNNTSIVNGSILSIEEKGDTDEDQQILRGNDSSSNNVMTESNSHRVNSGTRPKPLVKTRLVEIEVPCNSKVGTGNRANPVSEAMPGDTVGRHSHKWFEQFYGQNANTRICKTFVEVPISELNTRKVNVSNEGEMPQTVDGDHDLNDGNLDMVGDKIQNSEIGDQIISTDVRKSYGDAYIRPIIRFNQADQNTNVGVPKSYDNVYIRPILRFNHDVTQPSHPNIDPESLEDSVGEQIFNNNAQTLLPYTVTPSVPPLTATQTVQQQTVTQTIEPQKQRAPRRKKYSKGIFSFLIKSSLS